MGRNLSTSNGDQLREWRVALGRRACGQIAEAKAQCRTAYGHAKDAGGLAAAIADKLWADTLLAVKGQRPGVRAEMYTRTASLLKLLAERETWPK